MEWNLNTPEYRPEEGIRIVWVDGHHILVSIEDGEVAIYANAEGLITLATQILTLAQKEVPSGNHIHLTDNSGLSQGSVDLEIGKT